MLDFKMSELIRFQKEYNGINYSDVIILPDNHGKTTEEIDQLIEVRFQQWLYNRENPVEEVPSEEVPSEEVPSEEVPSEEVPSEEVPTIT
jgi:hypothetical protein